MADIFISYKSEDRTRARLVAEALQTEGFDVWYDPSLQAGEDYQEVIDRELRTALVVVVLWSQLSVKSRWVRSEATIGDRNGALAPIIVEPCELPTAFVLVQSADLSLWTGDRSDPAWREFMSDVAAKVHKRRTARTSGEPMPQQDVELVYWQSIRDSTDAKDLRAYLKRYPNGNFTKLADSRLSTLAKAAKHNRKAGGGMILVAGGLVATAVLAVAFLPRNSLTRWFAPRETSATAETASDTEKAVSPPSAEDDRAKAERDARDLDEAWNAARQAGTLDAYRTFLKVYPVGPYADRARAEIAALSKTPSAPAPSAPATSNPPSVAVAQSLSPPPAGEAWTIFATCEGGASVREPNARFVNGAYSRRFGETGTGGETLLRLETDTATQVRLIGEVRFDNGQIVPFDATGAGSGGFYSGTAKLGPGSGCPFTATRKSG
jgi:methylmalonyl-CoA mutase cobalamin-binding subunit